LNEGYLEAETCHRWWKVYSQIVEIEAAREEDAPGAVALLLYMMIRE
jgi:hypothetical protein